MQTVFTIQHVIQSVDLLLGDLLKLVACADRDTLAQLSIDPDELAALFSRPDYEAAARYHIKSLNREELIEALEEADVEDERDVDTIAVETIDARAEARRNEGDDFDPDQDIPWPGVADDELRQKLLANLAEQDDGFKDFSETNSLEPDYISAFEHWIVSDWLYSKLAEQGEIVGEVCGLRIWGRTMTGQAIYMDGVIKRIYEETK